MQYFNRLFFALAIFISSTCINAQEKTAHNPILFSDVPDIAIIRVGDVYYMSSTTTHMSPHVPIMKSTDLVNWKNIGYAADTLGSVDELSLNNGKNSYGRGSWASSLRYHNGTFYVTTFAQITNKTYIYSTKDIEKGPWKVASFEPAFHDHTLFFDDDGRTYLLYGSNKITLVELNADASGVKQDGMKQVVIENASLPAGNNIGLPAEGSQLFKIKGKYYLFNICWPRNGMRTVTVHRADKINGPYEGRLGFQDLGVAQGGLIDAPDGSWYSYLFRDYGSLGRIPYLVPVTWVDGWPVIGNNGKVPEKLAALPPVKSLIPGIVEPDNFNRKAGDRPLPFAWQWNHNPANDLWSVTERKGYLRLKTNRTDSTFLQARNTLTQRVIGPVCSGAIALDASNMKDGDFAGLSLLQKNFGQVGVQVKGNKRFLVMINAGSGKPELVEEIPYTGKTVHIKASCDFTDKKDVAQFFYSEDGKTWKPIGNTLKMAYTIPQFIGYRFGLFNYATKRPGGFADFDYFDIRENE